MTNKIDEHIQTEIFGEGICAVCGQDVEPTLHKGKLAVLMWCSSACTQSYAARFLTDKQAVFFKEYLIDLNATQAALRSGYSTKTARVIGSENLTKPAIKQAISLAMTERASHLKLTATKVMTDIELVRLDAIKPLNSQSMNNHSAALKASELQGRHMQLFVDKVEVELTDTIADRLQRAREREKDAS
jgi:hypothetical protein